MKRTLLFSAVLMACASYAQDNAQGMELGDGVHRLETVTVTGEGIAEASTEYVDSYRAEATSASTKISTSLREIPQSVTVITQERIKDQNLRTAQEYFQWIPGMGNVLNQEGFVNLRGFSAQTTVNGVPTGGLVGRTHADISAFDRIEVIKGPSGFMTGNGSPGGSINYQFKKPTAQFKAEGTLAAGSDSAINAGLDVGGKLLPSGVLRGRAVLFKDKRDEYVNVEERDRTSIYGVLEADLTPATVASLGFWRQENTAKQSFRQGLPAYTDGGLLDVDPRTSMTQDWADFRFKATWWLADVEHYFNDDWSAKLSFRDGETGHPAYYSAPGASRSGSGCGANTSFSGIDRNNPASAVRCFTTEFWTDDQKHRDVDAFLAGKLDLWGQRHDVVVGANWERNTFTRVLGSSFPQYDFRNDYFNPNPHVIDAPPMSGTPTSSNSSVTRKRGIYTRATVRINDWLKVPVGGRWSWVTNSDGSHPARAEFTPYLGLVADINRHWTVYGSYTETFNPSTARSWVAEGHPGNLLPHQSGEQLELGVKTFWFDNRLTATAAVYELTLENTSRADPDRTGFSLPTGEQRTRGVEFDVHGQVRPNWSVGTAYAYADAKYVSADVGQGQRVANAPTHSANLYTNYRFGDDSSLRGLSIGGGVRYAGKIYGSLPGGRSGPGPRLEAPGHTTAHLRAGYRINRHTELSVNVDNVFDKTYWQELGGLTGQNFYGIGRTWMATLRVNY